MSNITLSPNASGTGTLTIAAPNTNTNQTLTLPDNTGTILTSATTTGFPPGSVLQVVQGTYSTQTLISSTSYVDSGLSATITPTKTSSKILIIASMSGDIYRQSNNVLLVSQNIVRNSTQITEKTGYSGSGLAADGYFYSQLNGILLYLDSPATTSATTYKIQGKTETTLNSSTLRYNTIATGTSVITLMEIAA